MLIACKKSKLEFVKLLIENKVDLSYRNSENLDCLDIAIINNNYTIAYFLVSKGLKLRSLNEYMGLIDPKVKEELLDNNIRSGKKLFNLPLFYEHLEKMTDPAKIPTLLLIKGI